MMDKEQASHPIYTIYILLGKSNKQFYIGYFETNRLFEIYKKHDKPKLAKTAKWIRELHFRHERPCFFSLENNIYDKKYAMALVHIWTNIFIMQGYVNVYGQDMLKLTTKTCQQYQTEFEQRKNISITNLVSCANCLLPKYEEHMCPFYTDKDVSNKLSLSDYRTVTIKLTEDDYTYLQKKGKELKLSVAQYLLYKALYDKENMAQKDKE